jgi:glycosyltransferase involved in cell wall biosynthesis
MNIGMICYASVGGSGIVATELGKALATRGHQVHVISTETPFRFGDYQAGVTFHQVAAPAYPLFREPQYLLSIANKVVEVARDFTSTLCMRTTPCRMPLRASRDNCWRRRLAAGAESRTTLAPISRQATTRQIWKSSPRSIVRASPPSPRACAPRPPGLRVSREIEVIPNFLDCGIHRRQDVPGLREKFTGDDPNAKILVHVSNFRPVKRIDHVMAVFDRVRHRVPARLLLVGDGPDLGAAIRLSREWGIQHLVHAVVAQEEATAPPSTTFPPSGRGLASPAQTMASLPVVGSRVAASRSDRARHQRLLHPPDADGGRQRRRS